MPWNPDRYRQFEAQRAAPLDDLLSLIAVRDGLRVVDLGCGSGEITARLAAMLPGSDVLGLDSSAEMLAQAASLARPGLRFEQGDIAALDGTWDLIFSHAALQWVPDHAALIPRLLERLAPGGQFVCQVPANHAHPVHALLCDTAAEAPFAAALNGWTRPAHVLPAERYAELLADQGVAALTVFDKIYPVVLPGVDALVDWMRGTGLLPYLERLPDALHGPFLEAYRARLADHWPDPPLFYAFRRTLLAATRPA